MAFVSARSVARRIGCRIGCRICSRVERALFACEHFVTGARAAAGGPEACNRVPLMSIIERPESLPAGAGSTQRASNRLRLAVLDRDPGFMQVLSKRLDALGCEYRPLAAPMGVGRAGRDAAQRAGRSISPSSARPAGDTSNRCALAFPVMAVIVCTGPSSVAQRVRGLRLGADAWITKPCHRRGS